MLAWSFSTGVVLNRGNFDAPPPYLLSEPKAATNKECPQCWGGETLPLFIHVFQPLGLRVTWYWLIFTHVCVHVYMCWCLPVFTYVQMWFMYVYTYVEAGENLKSYPQQPHPSFLELVLTLAWSSPVRSGWQVASPQNAPVSIPQYCHIRPVFITRVLGTEHRF